ncbi:GNAT family N-acetyltransferase [Streptomyces sp. NPDC001793]|uniref:GNAT family N-acetyltransferase n=1 Tax=Streptomyces sp. NPDC001793 TaxID=3154657 RepID=UPI0033330B5D
MKVSLFVTGEEILGLLSSSVVNDLWSGGAHLPYWQPAALAARIEAVGRHEVALLVIEGDGGMAVGVLRHRRNGVISTLIPREPFLSNQPFRDADSLRAQLLRAVERIGARAVHLHETERNAPVVECLADQPDTAVVLRLPNPVIDWHDNGEQMLIGAQRHFGRTFWRRVRRWDREFEVTTVRDAAAIDVVENIERRSWKARWGTHLDEGELAFYRALLMRDECLLTLATAEGEPAAYFLEMRVGDVVYGMQSSYAETFARLSPGAFLTTIGLHRRWHGSGIATYDLLGGSGPLKDALASRAIARVDVAWPVCAATRDLLGERVGFDRHRTAASERGRGARHVAATYDS